VNGLLVTKVGLVALVSTLGMNFLIRGLDPNRDSGRGHPVDLSQRFHLLSDLCGRIPIFGVLFPVQMLWGLAFAAVGWWLFNRHQFGTHIAASAIMRKVPARWASTSIEPRSRASSCWHRRACAGVLSSLINNTFWPTNWRRLFALGPGGSFRWWNANGGACSDGCGPVIGVFIVGFIETGLISSGFSGFYTQFFYGVVLILSLITHRFNQKKRNNRTDGPRISMNLHIRPLNNNDMDDIVQLSLLAWEPYSSPGNKYSPQSVPLAIYPDWRKGQKEVVEKCVMMRKLRPALPK